jgi:hypothetical protein
MKEFGGRSWELGDPLVPNNSCGVSVDEFGDFRSEIQEIADVAVIEITSEDKLVADFL